MAKDFTKLHGDLTELVGRPGFAEQMLEAKTVATLPATSLESIFT
jgi:hypothetical protein